MCESTDKVPISTREGHSSDTKQIIPVLLGNEGLSLPSLQEPATCPDIILFDFITRIIPVKVIRIRLQARCDPEGGYRYSSTLP